MLKLNCHKSSLRIKETLKKRVLISFDIRANKKVDQQFTIIKDKFFWKMKFDRESFDFKYVDEIMSNLSLVQGYPTVFTIQGTFSCLLYKFAKLLSY